jgi:GH25 family lysozyme M1 (1,4-beta-N-acetylmuramidase)
LKGMRRPLLAALLAAGILLQAASPVSAAGEWWEEADPDESWSQEEALPDDPAWKEEGEEITSGDRFSVKALLRLAEEYDNIPEGFLESIARYDTLSLGKMEEYALEHKVPLEYIQRCFTDRFVFKAGDRFEFVSVDKSLPQNDFDWDNLVHKDSGEIRYIEGDVSRAYKGIDVSVYQGDIDWEKVKADGVHFAFIRLGYRGYGTGKLQLDEKFKQNIRGATKAGVKVGVYFYSQAISTREAREEANMVLRYIKDYDIDYPVVYDVEEAPSTSARTRGISGAQVTKNAIAFCDTIREAGYRPMIYTYSKWYVEKLDLSKLTKYDKWLAQYYKVPFFPYEFDIWQYSSKGRVNGIKGNVDMNLCFVNY